MKSLMQSDFYSRCHFIYISISTLYQQHLESGFTFDITYKSEFYIHIERTVSWSMIWLSCCTTSRWCYNAQSLVTKYPTNHNCSFSRPVNLRLDTIFRHHHLNFASHIGTELSRQDIVTLSVEFCWPYKFLSQSLVFSSEEFCPV